MSSLRDTVSGIDPELIRLRDDQIPVVKRETAATRKRKTLRGRMFIRGLPWLEFAAAVRDGVSSRAIGLWLAIRMQAKLDGREWVRVRTFLRQDLGFTNRAAHSRAVRELEEAGLIEVQRRKGYAPLVRLVESRSGGGGDGDGDEDDADV
jgi:hypothetical protein